MKTNMRLGKASGRLAEEEEKSLTFQLHHTYDVDGIGEPMTVVNRCVDFSRPGVNYVMLQQAEEPYNVEIYPVELDSDCEALLLPCPMNDENDFDEDGTPLPYWSPIWDCEDVTDRYPWED